MRLRKKPLDKSINPDKHIAKKSLGQHFLRSARALSDIIDAGDVHADDVVVEIGPGEGVLTERLLKLAGKVIAIEKDDSLAEKLKEKYATEITEGKFEILNQDVLDFDFASLKSYTGFNYKVIANIPYNITGILIRNILTSDYQPQHMVLLIQKEVADRIVARDNKQSLLSLSVKIYGTPKIIAAVPPGAFAPPPNVTSAIIAVSNISRSHFNSAKEEQDFFTLIHAGFAHKRKQLQANMRELAPQMQLHELFTSIELSPTVRAEDLSIEQWITLLRECTKQGIL